MDRRRRADASALEVEKRGVLQKWSKNIRRWQPRFVKTQRYFISYYKYKGVPPPENVSRKHATRL
jgi:hypothetical protein